MNEFSEQRRLITGSLSSHLSGETMTTESKDNDSHRDVETYEHDGYLIKKAVFSAMLDETRLDIRVRY